jgi:hypothetical protein
MKSVQSQALVDPQHNQLQPKALVLLFFLFPLGALSYIRETLVSLQFLNLRQLVGLLGRGSARRVRAKTFHALDRTATVIGA